MQAFYHHSCIDAGHLVDWMDLTLDDYTEFVMGSWESGEITWEPQCRPRMILIESRSFFSVYRTKTARILPKMAMV